MSRCFPFPPPGYEKKAVTADADLLKKEKQREKKHKKEKRDKEKKDKEKKESKEKREKEGRDGKHKEKKDKKEKHREKKKDKDKDRDKDKNKHNTADEKGFPGQAEGPIADKVNQKELKQTDKKNILSGEKFTRHYVGNNGEKARENNHLAEENKDSKFLKELGRRIRDEDTGTGNQLVQKFTIADHKKDEGTVRLVAKGSGTLPDGKEKLKDKTLDARKLDWQGLRTESRPSGNATVQNDAGNFHPRVDGMPGPLEKNFDRSTEATVERKEKVKEKKADDKRGDRRKDRDKEKKGHGKDKDRDKEKKKEEKAKEQTEHKSAEHSKLKESNKGGLVGTNSFAQVPRDSHENAVSGENLKKRKDIESNGVLHANDHWPSKMPRLSSSSHPFTENGRILDPFEISIPHASVRQAGAAKLKVDGKERKINGIIEARPSAVSSNKTNTVTVPVDPSSGETPAKPPHPDSKYLSQVYSVPNIEEWSGFDDQDWLFGSSSQERKPKADSSEVGATLQVWAEAVHIEPADVCALPYVIPY
ncbi:hypothetical protein L6164_012127 [Bauhinia variegata]|uniref:Uncharacterized protein n=1 Tax=Bauhinia variegata TaxID=167791 RepID=A0ACB9P850_BAUVA|nr:hypothetical protein L6164_012127 [Bauhinia variegata]